MMRDAVDAREEQRMHWRQGARCRTELRDWYGVAVQLVERERVCKDLRVRDLPVQIETIEQSVAADASQLRLVRHEFTGEMRRGLISQRLEYCSCAYAIVGRDEQIRIEAGTQPGLRIICVGDGRPFHQQRLHAGFGERIQDVREFLLMNDSCRSRFPAALKNGGFDRAWPVLQRGGEREERRYSVVGGRLENTGFKAWWNIRWPWRDLMPESGGEQGFWFHQGVSGHRAEARLGKTAHQCQQIPLEPLGGGVVLGA
jgi:hypothetical protein